MKIAAREWNLLAITLGVVVCALTYLALEPYLLEWKGFRDKQEELTSRLERAENMLARRESVTARLAEIRQGLPVFPAGKKVEAELLMTLEKVAGQHGLVLTRRAADAEKEAGDLFETAITCDWEGELAALVHFLYAQQTENAVSDVRHLSVQPASGPHAGLDRLKGSFTIYYAYRRENGATESKTEASPAPSAPEAPQPEMDTL